METKYKEKLIRSYHETARGRNENSREEKEFTPNKGYQNGQTKKDVETQIMLYDEVPRIQSPDRYHIFPDKQHRETRKRHTP